jgi:hypothetical protein
MAERWWVPDGAHLSTIRLLKVRLRFAGGRFSEGLWVSTKAEKGEFLSLVFGSVDGLVVVVRIVGSGCFSLTTVCPVP